MKNISKFATAVLWIAILCLPFRSALAQGTTFTYQGRLMLAGSPANGSYDLQFSLFTTNITGVPIAGPVTNTAIAVTNGLFTTMVNFGAGVFIGSSNWLQIAVSTNAANVFNNLSPRQQLTPVPYAIYAPNAGSASTAGSAGIAAAVDPGSITAAMLAPDAVTMLGTPYGGPTNAVNVSSNGLVGIGTGTGTPAAGLQIVNGTTEGVLSLLYEAKVPYNYYYMNQPSVVAATSNLVALGSRFDVTLENVANPSAPVILSQVFNGGSISNMDEVSSLAWFGSNLVVSANLPSAVMILGCTNPASPVKLAELDNGASGWNYLASPQSVAVSGNLLAIAAQNSSAVTLVNISNPSAPVLDSTLVNGQFGFTNLGGADAVAMSGNLMAIGAINSNAVTLVNISNPANPVLLAQLVNGVGGYNNLSGVTGVALSGNLLAIASEFSSAVTLVDVSNPSNPVLRAQLVNGVGGYSMSYGPTTVAFSGTQLAIGTSDETVLLVDVSNPSNPVLLATATDGVDEANYLAEPEGVAFNGTNLIVDSFFGEYLNIFGISTAPVGLDSAGWVGIGTTHPNAALDVSGNLFVENATLVDIGTSDTAIGYEAVATGSDATSIGQQTTASGTSSTAMGSDTIASGDYSTALGENSFASAQNSIVIGSYSTASGQFSMAMGASTIASGEDSTTMGVQTTASGNYSTAMGDLTTAGGDYSTVAGGYNNVIQTNSVYSFIGGGNTNTIQSTSTFSVIGGGYGNLIQSNTAYSVLGGGLQNTIYGDSNNFGTKVIVGGYVGSIGSNSWNSAIVGGFYNNIGAGAPYAFIGGGGNNSANGQYSTVPGGFGNYAAGAYSFAAGTEAQANNSGTFVWADNSGGVFGSTAANQFLIRAQGGVGIDTSDPQATLDIVSSYNPQLRLVQTANDYARIRFAGYTNATWDIAAGKTLNFFCGSFGNVLILTNNGNAILSGTLSQGSDRNIKQDFAPVNPLAVLDKVAALPITEWSYKADVNARHIGPMSQDFQASFNLNGGDDKHITTVDESGVALAAIQGLNQKIEEKDLKIQEQSAEIANLNKRLDKLEQLMTEKLGGAK